MEIGGKLVSDLKHLSSNTINPDTLFKRGNEGEYLQLDLLVRQKILAVGQQLESIPNAFRKKKYVERLLEAKEELDKCFESYCAAYDQWLNDLYDRSRVSFTQIVSDKNFVFRDLPPVKLVFKFEEIQDEQHDERASVTITRESTVKGNEQGKEGRKEEKKYSFFSVFSKRARQERKQKKEEKKKEKKEKKKEK